jgi:hypothetical protein
MMGEEISVLEQDDLAGPVPLTRHEQLSTSTASAVTLVSAPQATLEVTTLADTIDATDGLLSLREAITAANASAAPDTITFADSIRGGTIVLAEDLPTITRDLAIDGDPLDGGAGGISIDGGTSYGPAGAIGAYRVFNVDGATAHFEDMTFGHAIEVGLYSTGANVSLERNLVVANGYFHENLSEKLMSGISLL